MPDIKKPSKLTISLDYRVVTIVLLVIIGGMLIAWRPWQRNNDSRTVQVVGQAKLHATPDQFIFYPNYEFRNADKAAGLAELTAKSNEIVAKLKQIGVQENKIRTNSNGSDYKAYYPIEGGSDPTYTLSFTVTVDSRDLAQKVIDYLVTTTPLGGLSPQPGFSDAKRKELEYQARDEATKDARAKAEQNARNLGAKLGRVKDLSDGQGFDGGPVPLSAGSDMAIAETSSSLGILPGETEVIYTVNVTFYIR